MTKRFMAKKALEAVHPDLLFEKFFAGCLPLVYCLRMMRAFQLLLLSFVLAPSLRAIQFTPLSIEQLAQESALIVQGTVLSKSCQRDSAGRIFTKVELGIAEVWKGSLATNRFTVVHGGGILGDRKATVSGQVEYGIGEGVVAFVVFNQRGEGVTLGLAQGKFHIGKEAQTGERLVHNLFHGEAGSRGQGISIPDRVPTQRRLTLAELKRRVRGELP